ncbi:alpha-amylase/4-alpha-glucanotransferase domain-containing protein [Treponema pectinovorum]|uniref:alpha-amylase/4-alpha-glucanotransferase domain-containing protein n=1 Tax=Treponema pectinovorum TaxID=164 RepID=UPI0011CAC8A9|nr:alpha-amylase/4-alpha-glucanotransferase domain-containing protein [Treponema pectinovorum]
MKTLNICFSLTVNSTVLSEFSAQDKLYEKVLKNIISYLYKNPSSKMSFSFSGLQLEWLENKHPEFLTLLKQLLARKQIELLGGGYYNPVFPLLFPIDRTGQIELLTSELRRLTGKRPRGMSVLSSVWDNCLVPCFQNCGMEWVELDSSLISHQNERYLPIIVSENGKSVKILPSYRNLEQVIEKNISPEAYINSLLKQIEKSTKDDFHCAYTDDRIISVNTEPETMEKLLRSDWIFEFFEAAKGDFPKNVNLCLPAEFIRKSKEFVRSYIPSGVRADIAKWALKPYEPEEKNNTPLTIHNFLQTYQRCGALYNRILYISMLIGNSHGDKARKNSARASLWKAQEGEALICSPDGIFANNAMRQDAYRNLTEAEKYIREASPFKESVTSYDYNLDGREEYVCSMEKYTACITPRGGEINELDIIHNTGNYADNLSRIEKFDGVTDFYERGLFVEHLFDKDEFAEYKKGLPTGCGIFSRVLFEQTEFSSSRKEIKLKGQGNYSNLDLPVSLRKKYLMNSSGFTVQYILKNEGPIAFKGAFVVESNFAQTDFTTAQTNSYRVDLVSSGESITFDRISNQQSQKAISYMRVTDSSNDISFVYEPNEESGITCGPMYFRRPQVNSYLSQISGTTFVASLFWNVDLAAGMEMEKTINFTIITPKKSRGKKKQ